MSNSEVIVVVADSSGSMREHGKAMLARNLIAHVLEHARYADAPERAGGAIVVHWATEAAVVDQLPDQDLPQLGIGGRAQMQPLLTTLEHLYAGNGKVRVLLLSDGHIASADVAAFKAWQTLHPQASVRAVAVGPDAVRATLTKLADPGGVFPPEEVVCALTTWFLPRDPTLPERLNELVARATIER